MSLPERWVQVCITDEKSSNRFETFANRLISAIEGKAIIGTSKTYDLSVDGKNLRFGRNLRVFATIESRQGKVRDDAEGFVAHHKGDLDALYILSARATTEDTSQQHAKIVEGILASYGLSPRVIHLGAHSIAELVSQGYAEADFRSLYDGDMATVSKWSFYEDADISHERMRLALSTVASRDANEIRRGALDMFFLQAIRLAPKTLTQVSDHVAAKLRAGCIATAQLSVVAARLVEERCVDLQNENYVIRREGLDYISRVDQEGGRTLLEGRERIRAACEASLGSELTASQWQRTWNKFTVELSGLLQAKGQELIDVVSALVEQQQLKEERSSLAHLLEGVIERVSLASAEAVQRPVFQQALTDALLPGAPRGAFDWLAAVTANYAVICTLGLSSEVYGLVGGVLKTIRFLFDTDVVISLLLTEEPAHDAAATIHRVASRLGKPVLVPAAVVEESARHAVKSYVDHDVQVAGRPPLSWYDLHELQSAFTRHFEKLRMAGKVRSAEWQEFIVRFAGPRRHDSNRKLIPNTGLMREILVRDGLDILKRQDTSQVPQTTKDRLRDLIVHRVKERNPGYGDHDAVVQEKARIDAELLLQVSHAMGAALEEGQPDRYVLVTSASVLRHLPISALDLLDHRPEVLMLAETAMLATIIPESPLPLQALRALLFDTGASEIHGLGQRMMTMLRRATGGSLAGATRGVVHMEIRGRLIEGAKGTPLTAAQLERKALRDPTLFAKLVSAAVDAYSLEQKADKVDVLRRIKELAEHVGMAIDDEEVEV